jgi:ABC-type nitrate/sulfonate/bicarbonate transport system substrate-binding protein
MFKKALMIALLMVSPALAQPIPHGAVGSSPTAADLPLVVALAKNMFSSRGLSIPEATSFNNNATVQVALSTGDIKFAATTSMYNILQTAHNGMPLIWARAINSGPAFMLYAKPEIKTIADLRGKIVSAGGENDNTRLFTEILLNEGGLQYNDVNWFWSGSVPSRVAALSSKQIDAALLLPPFSFQAERDGFKLLGTTSDVKMVANKGVAFNRNWARANPDKVEKILAAIDESIEWIYDPKNLEEAATLLAVASKVNREDCLNSIRLLIEKRIYERTHNVYKRDIEYYVDASKKAGIIKTDAHVAIQDLVWDMKHLK